MKSKCFQGFVSCFHNFANSIPCLYTRINLRLAFGPLLFPGLHGKEIKDVVKGESWCAATGPQTGWQKIWAICLQQHGMDLWKGWSTTRSCCAAAQCVCVPPKLLGASLERTRENTYSPKSISAKYLENRTRGSNLFQQLLMELLCWNTNMDVHFMAQSTRKKQETEVYEGPYCLLALEILQYNNRGCWQSWCFDSFLSLRGALSFQTYLRTTHKIGNLKALLGALHSWPTADLTLHFYPCCAVVLCSTLTFTSAQVDTAVTSAWDNGILTSSF